MHKDKYKNFEELNKHEKYGEDFDIEKVPRKSDFAVIAIHGGMIEKGTAEIARHIAGEDLSFYAFIGRKDKNNFKDLHIKSDNFYEPACRELIEKCQKVVFIHGQEDQNTEFVMMGGLDKELGDKICKMLASAGFSLKETPGHLMGKGKTNVCNSCISGAGVQLELSKKLRDKLMSNKELLEKFAGAVRKAL